MSAWGALNVLGALFAFVASLLFLGFLWFNHAFTYWQKRGAEGPKPSIPCGNYSDVFTNKISMSEFLKKIYNDYKNKRFIGAYMFGKPIFVVNDVELANRILGADFTHFESHGPDIDEKLDPLGSHLFNATGKKWKELRNKMTPAFTTGKMKGMFLIMEQVGNELQKVFESPAVKGAEVEVQDLIARYTTDIIGNTAFGVECNSLKDEDAPFRRCGQRIFSHNRLEGLKVAAGFFLPEMCSFLGISPQKKDVTEFIFKSITETVKYREENDVKRNDFLDLLIRINNKTLEDDQGNRIDFSQGSGFTPNEFMSQVYLFFVAGFETSSGTTSFALYELACNPHVQERARQQVRAVLKKHSGPYTYDAMMEMDYLANITNETLRMYPPVPMMTRKCTKTYKVPDSKVTVEKGTMVFIPIIGMQMDEEFFPDPEKFDPDRFSGENRHPNLNKIHMPFGQGPRVCIETLRMYPPVPMMTRKCTKTYKVPDSKVTVEKGTMVFIPIIGMQMDEEFFPDPEKFDPDRFSGENRHPNLNKIHMPFGQGPRVCIGQRFGMMQSKVALAKLLDKFTFSVGQRTPVPMKLKPGFSMVTPDAGLWLKVGLAPTA